MRFPVPYARCDSPHRTALDPGIPIAIETKGHSESPCCHAPSTEKRVRKKANPSGGGGAAGEPRHRAGVAMIAAKSYRQGYMDASSLHLSHSLIPPVRQSSVIPTEWADTAAQYPLITIAAIGLGAGVIFSSAAYLGHRAIRSLTVEGSEAKFVTPAFWGRKMDNLERRVTLQVQAAAAENRREMEVLKKDLIQSLKGSVPRSSLSPRPSEGALPPSDGYGGGTGGSAGDVARKPESGGSDIAAKISDLEGQITAANRDRRSELHTFRAELMGQLQVLEGLAKETKDAAATNVPKTSGRSAPILRIQNEGKKAKSSEGDYAPIAPHHNEARLAQVLRGTVEDVLSRFTPKDSETEGRETITEAPYASTEVGEGEKAALEHLPVSFSTAMDGIQKSISEIGKDIGRISFHLGLPRDVVQDAPEDWANRATHNEDDHEPNRTHRPSHAAYATPLSKPKTSEEHAKDEATRAQLYDKITEAKERYQAIMDSTPEHTAGTSAEQMAQELNEAAEKAKVRMFGVARSKEVPTSSKPTSATSAKDMAEQLEEAAQAAKVRAFGSARAQQPRKAQDEPAHTATSARTTTSINENTSRKTEDSSSSFPPNAHSLKWNPLDHVSQLVKDQYQKQFSPRKEPEKPKAPMPTVRPGPRLGVDDSGSWKFFISNIPDGELRGAGWRTADVIYEKGSSVMRRGQTWIFSSASSGQETYTNVKIFFYPEFDIVRLDGHLWRCTREAKGLWSIRERIGEAREPEWDGVGYEKD